MSTYETTNTASLALAEQYLYGSSRLGVLDSKGRSYELTDHLGNVRAVVGDDAVVKSATDYYPFGMTANAYTPNGYRYGFNTQEKVDEISPGHYTAEFWEYDSRIGRRWNIDPEMVEWESPYAVNRDNPVSYTDPYGNCPDGNCGEKEVVAAQKIVNKLFDKKKNLKDISSKINAEALKYYIEEFKKGNYSKDAKVEEIKAFVDLANYLWRNTIATSMMGKDGSEYDKFKAGVDNGKLSEAEKARMIIKVGEENFMKQQFFFGLVVPTVLEHLSVAMLVTVNNVMYPTGGAITSKAASFWINFNPKQLKSFNDIVDFPKSLWGRSAEEVAKILGSGWTRGVYGSKGMGWKFFKGQQSVFYHPGGGSHVGSYYGFSSGKLGKIKLWDLIIDLWQETMLILSK